MFIMEKIGTVVLAGKKNGEKRKITSYKVYYMIEPSLSGLWQATRANFGCQYCVSLGLHVAHTQCILLPSLNKKHLL